MFSTHMKNIAFILVIAGILLRLIPHEPNFAPIAAIALFSSVYLPRKYALIIPLSIIIISDFFLGWHNTILFTWGSFLLIGIIGLYLKNHKNIVNTLSATLGSSLLFFIITNLGVWLMTAWYPKTLIGLVNCYTMAIPFFKNTLLSDLFYVTVFFGSYELVKLYYYKKISNKQTIVAISK